MHRAGHHWRQPSLFSRTRSPVLLSVSGRGEYARCCPGRSPTRPTMPGKRRGRMGQRPSRPRPPSPWRDRPRRFLCHPHVWAARVVALLCIKDSRGRQRHSLLPFLSCILVKQINSLIAIALLAGPSFQFVHICVSSQAPTIIAKLREQTQHDN